MENTYVWLIVFFVAIFAIPILVTRFLTTVPAGTIRMVSWLSGVVKVYKGPCKSLEVPLFTTSATIPSKAINIDLEISDQTADVDRTGQPRPIKVRVLASAIVSVGDSNEMIRTAANRFFSKPPVEQNSTLTDLLTSTGRRAINLLHHDELFNTKVDSHGVTQSTLANESPTILAVAGEEEDRLAIIIKSACSRELQDLGLAFNSLNIKEVQSEVAEARRRQSAAEARANADIVQADQERRAREAQLGAEQAVNDKQRDLEERRAQNAAVIATAEAKKQDALQSLREAELRATQIAQANADAEKMKINATAAAEAEAIRIRRIAEAQAEAIDLVNKALIEGGNGYLSLRQLEMVPEIAPQIANALAQSKMINIANDGKGAATGAADQITSVIQTVLAANLVNQNIRMDWPAAGAPRNPDAAPTTPTPAPAPQPQPRPMAPVAAKPKLAIPPVSPDAGK